MSKTPWKRMLRGMITTGMPEYLISKIPTEFLLNWNEVQVEEKVSFEQEKTFERCDGEGISENLGVG